MRKGDARPPACFHTVVSAGRVMGTAGESGGGLDFSISRGLPELLQVHFISCSCVYKGLWLRY